jgi:hypothetical protein
VQQEDELETKNFLDGDIRDPKQVHIEMNEQHEERKEVRTLNSPQKNLIETQLSPHNKEQ